MSIHCFQKKVYVLNLETRVCTERELTEEFQPLAVPDNAIYRGQAIVGVEGSTGNSLNAAIWVGTDSTGGEWGCMHTTICTSILHIAKCVCVSVCLCVVPICSQTCLVSTLKCTLNPYFFWSHSLSVLVDKMYMRY